MAATPSTQCPWCCEALKYRIQRFTVVDFGVVLENGVLLFDEYDSSEGDPDDSKPQLVCHGCGYSIGLGVELEAYCPF